MNETYTWKDPQQVLMAWGAQQNLQGMIQNIQQLKLYCGKEFYGALRYEKASEKQMVYPPPLPNPHPPPPPLNPTYLYGMHCLSLLLHEFVD